MAEMTINLSGKIHAEIILEKEIISSNTPVILDPITNSYTEYKDARLIYYNLEVISIQGLTNPRILNNGKNSRFTASGEGECTIRLTIEDSKGNTDTDDKTIYIE